MHDLTKVHTETPEDSNLRMALRPGVDGLTLRTLACYTPCWGKWHDQSGVEIKVMSWLYIYEPKQGKE